MKDLEEIEGPSNRIRRQLTTVVMSALYAALLSASSYVFIPIGPVPITLTGLTLILIPFLTGFRISLYGVALYLLLGLIGLPLFAGGGAGYAVFFSPAGGYLLGYIPCSLLSALGSLEAVRRQPFWARCAFFLAIGLLADMLIYIPALPLLKHSLALPTWRDTLLAGLTPFIIGDALKIVLAAVLGARFAPQPKAAYDDA